MGLFAPQHVGSSWTRSQTRVSCIGKQILNHCAIREALTKNILTEEEGKTYSCEQQKLMYLLGSRIEGTHCLEKSLALSNEAECELWPCNSTTR